MSDAAANPAQDPSQPFTARAVALMIVVGVVAFCGFVVLSTYAPQLRSGHDGRGHALSRSANGFAGIVTLLNDVGVRAQVERGRIAPGGLRVLTPEPGGDPALLRRSLQDAHASGNSLVVMPKWVTTPDPLHRGWVSRVDTLPTDDIAAVMPQDLRPQLIRADGAVPVFLTTTDDAHGFVMQAEPVGRIEGLQSFQCPDCRPLIVDQQGRWLMVRLSGHEGLYFLSDPDLLDNLGLKDPRRAEVMVRMLARMSGDQPIIFDVSPNGFGATRSLLRLAFDPPFLGATLCAVIAALLIGWQAAVRFGAPRPSSRALALGKAALADNTAALLKLAGREPRMAWPYAELTMKAVARAVGAPRQLDQTETLALLDRLAAREKTPETPSAMMAEANTVRDNTSLMRLARRLYDFRRGMTRERD